MHGPLASANQALAWLIFFRRREWLRRLNDNYDVGNLLLRPFSALSYMATGGISRRLPRSAVALSDLISNRSRLQSPLSEVLCSVLYRDPNAALMSVTSVVRSTENKSYHHAYSNLPASSRHLKSFW